MKILKWPDQALELFGLYPLSCWDFEKHPDVVGELSYVPDAGSKSLLFSYTYASLISEDGVLVTDNDEFGIDDEALIAVKLNE